MSAPQISTKSYSSIMNLFASTLMMSMVYENVCIHNWPEASKAGMKMCTYTIGRKPIKLV